MVRRVSLVVCALVAALPVMGQAPAGNDAMFRYRGADRDGRLVARAKQEGSVVLYTSLAPTESKPLADAFQTSVGLVATPVAPFTGVASTGAGGGGACAHVVNLQVTEYPLVPPALLAATRQ